ncbi:hypothetical protein ATL39_0840 [Sinobaca qinghaiensis]|uniref:Uncharacterized protein n=1 Tax=Sinobaca qinghaiensis TaxID=342944 RepID=A0A419V586_9BACL|nr:hypothetical protein [Sinobaca qinghaiensis]RKD75144.1 hypothetical protein ATL39_0840 [Sinobaca qinghaiensis]
MNYLKNILKWTVISVVIFLLVGIIYHATIGGGVTTSTIIQSAVRGAVSGVVIGIINALKGFKNYSA